MFIQMGKYDEPRWLSEGSKNILRCMLQLDPKFRLSVRQLLNHTWCQEGNSIDEQRLHSCVYSVCYVGTQSKLVNFEYPPNPSIFKTAISLH